MLFISSDIVSADEGSEYTALHFDDEMIGSVAVQCHDPVGLETNNRCWETIVSA